MTVNYEFNTFKSDTFTRLDRFARLAPLAARDDGQFGAITNRTQKVRYLLASVFEQATDLPIAKDHMAVLVNLGGKLDAMLDLAEIVLNSRGETVSQYDERTFVGDIAGFDIEQLEQLGDIICGNVTGGEKGDIAHVAAPLIDTDFFDGPAIVHRFKTILLLILQILVLLRLVSEKTQAKVAEIFKAIDELLEFFGGGFVISDDASNMLDPIHLQGDGDSVTQFVPDKALYRFKLVAPAGTLKGKVEVRVNGVLMKTLTQSGQTADVSGRASVMFKLVTKDPKEKIKIQVCVLRAG